MLLEGEKRRRKTSRDKKRVKQGNLPQKDSRGLRKNLIKGGKKEHTEGGSARS